MPPALNPASSPASHDAVGNQTVLSDQAADTLSWLADPSSHAGTFFFSLNFQENAENLLTEITRISRGRTSVLEGRLSEQAVLAEAMYRESVMAVLTHESYLAQAEADIAQDKLYCDNLIATLGLVLTANTAEQRGR